MKHLIVLFLVVSLLISSCSDDDNPVDSNSDALKKEAVDFSLQVVNCYFTQDTTAFRSYLAEMLYMMDPEEPPYETSYFIISHFLSSYDYSDYNLDTYKDTYDYYVMDYEEYSMQYSGWISSLDYWQPTNKDFLFFGFEPKEDKSPFMNFEPLIFFVTKSSGEWKIRAIQ